MHRDQSLSHAVEKMDDFDGDNGNGDSGDGNDDNTVMTNLGKENETEKVF